MELLEHAKQLKWGTYGPGAAEANREHGTPLPPIAIKPLGELDTDHLVRIARHVGEFFVDRDEALTVVGAIRLILDDRKRND